MLDVEYVHEAGREEEWRIIQNADLIFVNQEGDEQLKRLKLALKVSPAPVVSTGRTGYAYFLHLLPSGK